MHRRRTDSSTLPRWSSVPHLKAFDDLDSDLADKLSELLCRCVDTDVVDAVDSLFSEVRPALGSSRVMTVVTREILLQMSRV